MKEQELKDEVMRQYLRMYDKYAKDKRFIAGRRYELEKVFIHAQLYPVIGSGYREFYHQIDTPFLLGELSELEKKAMKWVKR